MMKKIFTILLLISLTSVVVSHPAAAQTEITITDLNLLGCAYCNYGLDINDQGQVVGIHSDYHRAYLWQDGAMTDLGTLGSSTAQARAINNRGQAVGSSYLDTPNLHGFLWQDGVMSDLGTLGHRHSEAYDINEMGQVVGYSVNATEVDDQAFLWQDSVMIALGTLGGPVSTAYNINNLGQVVGRSKTSSGYFSAFLWQDGVMFDLGAPGGRYSQANAINNLGQVVGASMAASGYSHAVLWQDGEMIDLGTLGGRYSVAAAINDLGQVVGTSQISTGDEHAFLWQDGVMTDLGTLGGSSYAYAINNLGQVVGSSDTTSGAGHAVLWTVPLPLPEQQIKIMIKQVSELAEEGILNEGQGNSLISQLENILAKLEKGSPAAACNQLSAFIDHVQSFVDEEVLTSVEGQMLIDPAQRVHSQLCP